MPKIPRPDIECERHHATLAVADVPATVDFYTNKLGFTLGFLWGGEPPTLIGVLHSRHGTILLRSCSSTSMYLRHFGFGHCTAKTMFAPAVGY